MESNLSFELLADYVDGLVDKATRERIEKQLASNEDSRIVLEGIHYFYETHGRDRDALERYLNHVTKRMEFSMESEARQAYQSVMYESSLPFYKRPLFRQYAVAAAIALTLLSMAVLYFVSTRTSPDALVLSELEVPYLNPDTNRSADEPVDAFWNDAVYNYSNGRYQRTIKNLENMIDMGKGDPEKYFYLGLSHLYKSNQDPIEAINNFRKVLESENMYTEQAGWYLALSYYRAGRIDECKELLEQLSQNPRNYKKASIEKLLKKL